MVLNPTKLKETNHSDLLFWEYKVSEWNLPFLWREDTCTWERKQAGAKFLSPDFVIIKVHMALQKLCLTQNINLLKAMNYLLGQGVSKEWLLLQQSAAVSRYAVWCKIKRLLLQFTNEKPISLPPLCWFFSPQTKLKSKQNPKAVMSKRLKRVFHLTDVSQWEGLDWAAAMPVWWHCTPWLFVPASDDG